MSQRISYRLSLAPVFAAFLTGGCVTSSLSPVALATPEAPQALPNAITEPVKTVPEPEPDDDTVAQSDRVPTPSEIFDFHVKGPHGDTWRQPFLIDPHDGPLKIHHWTDQDMAKQDAERTRLLEPELQERVTKIEKPADRRKVPAGDAPVPANM